jgi:hypothetical protein
MVRSCAAETSEPVVPLHSGIDGLPERLLRDRSPLHYSQAEWQFFFFSISCFGWRAASPLRLPREISGYSAYCLGWPKADGPLQAGPRVEPDTDSES